MELGTKFRATCKAGVTFTPESINIDADSISVWCDFLHCPARGNPLCPCCLGQGALAVFIYFPQTKNEEVKS